MACEVCEHCQSPVTGYDKIIIREGYSYHKKCHKCYVCSETNLANAEVFKGVIFCSSCAQRIFQGCSTARRIKTPHAGRSKRTRSKSHRRRERRQIDRRADNSRDGVIELAGLGASTTDSDDATKKNQPSKTEVSTEENALQVNPEEKVKEVHDDGCFYFQNMKHMKIDSTEMGMTTDVTEELLRQINWPVAECKVKPYGHAGRAPRRHHRREPKDYKPFCSDLRIAELGKSTEIANMALRKKSEMPVIIKSETRLDQPSYSLSVLHQESDISGDGREWTESCTYSSTRDDTDNTRWMDRRIGSILKLPIRCFKRNILDRSSLISVLMSSNTDKNISLFRRIKDIFYEEVVQHQESGLRKLYSSINRRKIPYKLGWVEMAAKTSSGAKRDSGSSNNKVCTHFKTSHSYRCMRAQVMKLAGPTKSELALYRAKIKKLLAPSIFRKFCNSSKYIVQIGLT